MTDDLVAFLRARLAEDEHVGRMADIGRGSGTGPWELWTITNPARGEVHATPSRVLAEVEAKRRILDEIVPSLEAAIEKIEEEWVTDWWHPGRAEDLLRLLAEPYAGHPDYRDEWKP